jgi:hypothetical protein
MSVAKHSKPTISVGNNLFDFHAFRNWGLAPVKHRNFMTTSYCSLNKRSAHELGPSYRQNAHCDAVYVYRMRSVPTTRVQAKMTALTGILETEFQQIVGGIWRR